MLFRVEGISWGPPVFGLQYTHVSWLRCPSALAIEGARPREVVLFLLVFLLGAMGFAFLYRDLRAGLPSRERRRKTHVSLQHPNGFFMG